MVRILVLSDFPQDFLPGLELLNHQLTKMPADALSIARSPVADITLIDARRDLSRGRSLCQLLWASGISPVLAVMNEAGLVAMNEAWQADDFILTDASPGEVEARIRRSLADAAEEGLDPEIRAGGLVIDEPAHAATISGHLLNLTYKEFELLKHLALHPGEVLTREGILHEVWGYDYFGGPRTVDVHIRRLRAKLGPAHKSLIATVRNVGYRLAVPRQHHRD